MMNTSRMAHTALMALSTCARLTRRVLLSVLTNLTPLMDLTRLASTHNWNYNHRVHYALCINYSTRLARLPSNALLTEIALHAPHRTAYVRTY